MIFYNRTVKGETRAESDAYAYQAAFNSDGCITIRGTIRGLKGESSDETMLVLSESETRAIFQLMKKISANARTPELPF